MIMKSYRVNYVLLLPDHVIEEIMNNLHEQDLLKTLNQETDNFKFALRGLFHWSKSKQGNEYWANIADLDYKL